jgi:hypothetical protein
MCGTNRSDLLGSLARNFPRSVNPHRNVVGAMPQAVPVCRWEPSLRGERIGNASRKTIRSIRDKGGGEKSCCTKFWALHILLHKRLPKSPKIPHFYVVPRTVSC